MASSIFAKWTIDNPLNIPPQPGLEILVTLSQFLGWEPEGFANEPLLAPVVNEKRPLANSNVTSLIEGLNPTIEYWIQAASANWGGVYDVAFGFAGPFTTTDNQTTSVNLTGNVRREPK